MNEYSGQSIFPEEVISVDSNDIPQLVGQFHLKNVSMAVAICCKIGFSLNRILPLLKSLKSPEGRFELINIGQLLKVIVDFAHLQMD